MQFKLKTKHYLAGKLLWSNHFYGICIAGLAICSSLVLTDCFPSISFLIMIYIATVIYYTNAYFNETMNENNQDRVIWYQVHYENLKKRQWLLGFILLAIIIYNIITIPNLLDFNLIATFCLVISAISSILYNRTNFKKHGLSKSFVIAFVWTTAGGYLPLYFNSKIGHESSLTSSMQLVYLIQMFLFIFLLAAIFDIKDMKYDQLNKIKTIPIRIGANNMIGILILPILILYIFLDILQYRQIHLTFLEWTLQCLFYLLVYFASKYAIQVKSISRSILLIDGLMILKALVGILTWYWVHKL